MMTTSPTELLISRLRLLALDVPGVVSVVIKVRDDVICVDYEGAATKDDLRKTLSLVIREYNLQIRKVMVAR